MKKFIAFCSSFVVSTSALAVINGTHSNVPSVVKFEGKCSGVFINTNYILTSHDCAEEANLHRGTITDGNQSTYSVRRVFTNFKSITNNVLSANSDVDLGIIETSDAFTDAYAGVVDSASGARPYLSEAMDRYKPSFETLRVVSYGPQQVRSNFGVQNTKYINYRYPLDSRNMESVYGSRFIGTCAGDQGAPIVNNSNNVIGVLTRPLFTDQSCGTHEGWIVSNTFSQKAKRFIQNFAGNNPGNPGNGDGGDDQNVLLNESINTKLCNGWGCNSSWESNSFRNEKPLKDFTIIIDFGWRKGTTTVEILGRGLSYTIEESENKDQHQIRIPSSAFLNSNFWYAGDWKLKVSSTRNAKINSIKFEGSYR